MISLGIVVVAVLVIALIIMAAPIIKKRQEQIRKTGKYPEGYWIGIGMAMGLSFGMPLGIATGSIALGPGFGLPIGLAIGASLEQRYKKEGKIRPLTKKEKKEQEKMVKIVLGTLALGVIMALAAVFLI